MAAISNLVLGDGCFWRIIRSLPDGLLCIEISTVEHKMKKEKKYNLWKDQDEIDAINDLYKDISFKYGNNVPKKETIKNFVLSLTGEVNEYFEDGTNVTNGIFNDYTPSLKEISDLFYKCEGHYYLQSNSTIFDTKRMSKVNLFGIKTKEVDSEIPYHQPVNLEKMRKDRREYSHGKTIMAVWRYHDELKNKGIYVSMEKAKKMMEDDENAFFRENKSKLKSEFKKIFDREREKSGSKDNEE